MLSSVGSYWATILPAFVTAFLLMRIAQRAREKALMPVFIAENKS